MLKGESSPSNRIGLIEKSVFQSEVRGQVFAQRLNPETFGGMMARGDECDAGFVGQMEILLGNLPGDICVHTLRDRIFEVSLCGSGAPRHPLYAFAGIPDDLRSALQRAGDLLGELRQA